MCATSTAAANSWADLTFVVPRLEPPRAGLTNNGYPSAAAFFSNSARWDFHSFFLTTKPGTTFIPWDAKIGLAKDLSIATALARTPLPTYAMFAISQKP